MSRIALCDDNVYNMKEVESVLITILFDRTEFDISTYQDGVEVVEAPIPLVITVNASAADIRPQNASLVMKYKYAMTPSEMAANPESLSAKMTSERDYLKICEMTADDIECDEQQLGLLGSPTKVKKIENVVFQAKEAKRLSSSDEDINELMVELIASHTLG